MRITIDEFCHDIASFISVNDNKVTPQTKLCEDLGIAGEDGEDLISYLEEKYNVKISNFDYMKYFGSEPDTIDALLIPLIIILSILGFRWPKQTVQLTVEKLFLIFQNENTEIP